MRFTPAHIDALNVGLIAASCAAAHAFPYQLLLIAYAVLGPAHYLTEISWLHDRRYFVSVPQIAPILAGLAIFGAVAALTPNGISTNGRIVAAAFALALIAATLRPRDAIDPRTFVLGLALVLWALLMPALAVAFALLVPTVVHVFVFTACFLWDGARRSGRPAAYAVPVALALGAASFAAPTSAPLPSLAGIAFFAPVTVALQSLLPLASGTSAQLFGFLSFAYTYHYLNWFSKAEIIRWHHIPRPRAIAIAVLYAGSLALYALSYAVGFWVLITVSLAHVLLEFPLNVRTLLVLTRPSIPHTEETE